MKHSWLTKGLAVCLVALLLCNGLPALAAQPLPVEGPEQIALALTGDATQMAVSWAQAEVEGTVRYAASPDLADAVTLPAECTRQEATYAYLQATMTGLQPNTTYYYQVCGESGYSDIQSFTTEGTDDGVSFLYMTDVQYSQNTGSSPATEYAQWGDMLTAAKAEYPDAAFGLLGGDYVGGSEDMDQWQLFRQAASRVFAGIPMMTAPGNHECNDSPDGSPNVYLSLFCLPQQGPAGYEEEFYSYDYGNTHFTVLSSDVFLSYRDVPAQDLEAIRQWIADDLENSRATWNIVVLHHPVYWVVFDRTAAKMRSQWGDVLENSGVVDLVLCGHQHVYMRTYPVLDGNVDEQNGIPHVMGLAGQKYYAAAEVDYSAKMIDNTPCYQAVQIQGASLTLTCRDAAGNVLDSYTYTAKHVQGDVDGNGSVTLYDALLALRCATGNLTPTSQQLRAADVDGDGSVSFEDVNNILQYYVGNLGVL